MMNSARVIGYTLLSYLFPSLRDAIFIAVLLAVSAQGHMLLNADGDLGRHITIGNYIAETRTIPTADVFSHTMYGERLVPHEWLVQWTFGRVHTIAGLDGIVSLIALLIAAAFTLVYREIRKRNIQSIIAFAVAVLAAYASSLHWLARPHVFTFLFIAVWTQLLADRNSRIWYFPLIMLVWANAHGAFITGFAVWFAHMAGWTWDYLHKRSDRSHGLRLIIIGLLSLAITLINPAGWDLWRTSGGYYGNEFLVNSTVEYLSPNFHNWSTWPFLIMLAICMLGLGIRVKLKTYEAFLLVGWMMLSLYSARNIPLFAIITAPYVATIIQTILSPVNFLQKIETPLNRVEGNQKGIILPLLAVVLLVSNAMSYKGLNAANTFDPDKFPEHAVDWLEENPQEGEMFNNFIWGGYLLYRLFPRDLVFIDGQTDFYGEAFSREYAQVMRLENGWEGILIKYNVSWVIVETSRPLVSALQSDLNWRVVYQDSTATILQKP
jgi:hypothetical protein